MQWNAHILSDSAALNIENIDTTASTTTVTTLAIGHSHNIRLLLTRLRVNSTRVAVTDSAESN